MNCCAHVSQCEWWFCRHFGECLLAKGYSPKVTATIKTYAPEPFPEAKKKKTFVPAYSTENFAKRKKNPKIRPQYTEGKRKVLHRKTLGICYLCGHYVKSTEVSVDHFIPVSKGGGNELKNLFATHALCNSIKSSDIVDYPAHLISNWYKKFYPDQF